jgi:hypothetical protein
MINNSMHAYRDRLACIDLPKERSRTVFDNRAHVLRANGRNVLDEILENLSLSPSDEVLITNSSGQRYISGCVTCTVFNHCKPTRVPSDRVKAIILIHEYGVPHPRTTHFVEWGRERGIPVIEDCAHSIDSSIHGKPIGSFGDYALFSLAKVTPSDCGGALVADDVSAFAKTAPELKKVEGILQESLKSLAWFSRRRRECFNYLLNAFPRYKPFFQLDDSIVPFFVGLHFPLAGRVRQISNEVNWGSTFIEDLLLVPTNPLIEPEELAQAIERAVSQLSR